MKSQSMPPQTKDYANSLTQGPVVLCILDGWGYSEQPAGNSIAQARTPVWDHLWQHFPHTLLEASGGAVGLPEGQMGNSEVGHLTIGLGQALPQELPRIHQAIQDGSLARNPKLQACLQKLKSSKGRCHIMGLLSDGGVHSHIDHIIALANSMTAAGVPVCVHAFLDGRDTAPRSALAALAKFRSECFAPLATVSGRYYAMDRDHRWDRTHAAFEAIAHARGERSHSTAPSAEQAIEDHYARNLTDEFVQPTVIGDGIPIQEGDALLMANFRADRVIQLLSAFVVPDFTHFDRGPLPKLSTCLGMNDYSSDLVPWVTPLFTKPTVTITLGSEVAQAGLKQLRIAETEKYAHVTYFLNGGHEQTYPGEERLLIASPRVAHYNATPGMSAPEITEKLCKAILGKDYALIVVNFANADMVGHTGDFDATVKAIEALDECLSKITQALVTAKGCMLITADHGNAEQMLSSDHTPQTAHTTYPVPALFFNPHRLNHQASDPSTPPIAIKANGTLADVAPTVLTWLGLPVPHEMSGSCLFSGET